MPNESTAWLLAFMFYYSVALGALFMVMLAVATQWIADIIYTFLNPRIRYS